MAFLSSKERHLHFGGKSSQRRQADALSLIKAATAPKVMSEVEILGGDVLERWCSGLSVDLQKLDELQESMCKVIKAFSTIKLPPCSMLETLHSATHASCAVLDAAQAQIWLVDEIYGFDIIGQIPNSDGYYRETRVPVGDMRFVLF